MRNKLLKKAKSIKSTLIFLLFFSSIIPLILLEVTHHSIFNSFIVSDLLENYRISAVHEVEALNSFSSSLERALEDITGSEATKGYLQVRDNDNSEIKYINLVRLAEKLESLIYQQDSAIDGVCFVWLDGTPPIIRYNNYSSIITLPMLKGDLYSKMLVDTPMNSWLISDELIFLYKSLYSPISGENIGVVIIKVNSAYVKDMIGNNNNSSSLLLSDGKIALGSTQNNLFDGDASDDVYEVLNSVDGVEIIDINGEKAVVTANSTRIPSTKTVDIISLEGINYSRKQMLLSSMLVLALASLIAVVFSILISKYVNDPIDELEKCMSEFENGNLDSYVDIDRSDEFGALADNFNSMVNRIKTLINEIEEEHNNKQRIEMNFLQAQITPHFLYNSLNALKILAKQDRKEDVIKMSTSLITLLRLASKGSEKISLEQELQYTRDYVSLMSIRRDEEIELTITASEDLLNNEILKFTIQPIVENSIIHENVDGLLKILVDVYRRDDDVVIVIKDNAGGFDKNILNSGTSQNNKFSSIGINNVEERIKLYYGDRYGVKISSVLGDGTTIEINLPIKPVD